MTKMPDSTYSYGTAASSIIPDDNVNLSDMVSFFSTDVVYSDAPFNTEIVIVFLRRGHLSASPRALENP
jgi:hypothetical protein